MQTKLRLPGKLINTIVPAKHGSRKWRTIWKLTPNVLEKAGYRFFPTHSYANHWYEQEWITGAGWLQNTFPRFHIIKDNGFWYIHLDEMGADKNKHGRTRTEDFRIDEEIKRLRQIALK